MATETKLRSSDSIVREIQSLGRQIDDIRKRRRKLAQDLEDALVDEGKARRSDPGIARRRAIRARN